MIKLDVLVFAAHPDDAELSCSGIIASLVDEGKKVGMVDFTQGELGTRGTPEIRAQEATRSAEILGLTLRENMGFEDGFFENNREHQIKLIEIIRRYQPDIVLANAPEDRHIDHSRGASLAKSAYFLSGLKKIITYSASGQVEEAWRPQALYHYIQDYYLEPSLVVDISPYWEKKLESIQAFSSQFYHPDHSSDQEPRTPISSKDFIQFLEGRAREMGRMIGVEFGEGLIKATPPGVKSLYDLI